MIQFISITFAIAVGFFGVMELVRINEAAADRAEQAALQRLADKVTVADCQRDTWTCVPLRGDTHVICEVPPYSIRVEELVQAHRGCC